MINKAIWICAFGFGLFLATPLILGILVFLLIGGVVFGTYWQIGSLIELFNTPKKKQKKKPKLSSYMRMVQKEMK